MCFGTVCFATTNTRMLIQEHIIMFPSILGCQEAQSYISDSTLTSLLNLSLPFVSYTAHLIFKTYLNYSRFVSLITPPTHTHTLFAKWEDIGNFLGSFPPVCTTNYPKCYKVLFSLHTWTGGSPVDDTHWVTFSTLSIHAPPLPTLVLTLESLFINHCYSASIHLHRYLPCAHIAQRWSLTAES